MPIDPRIDNRVATYGVSRIKITTTCTTEVIIDTVRIKARSLQTPGHVIRMFRYYSTPSYCDIAVRYPRMNSPVLIGCIIVFPKSLIMWSQDIVSIHGSTSSAEVGDTQKFNTSIDGNSDENRDYTTIFKKVIGRELSCDSRSDIYLRFVGWAS